MSFFSYPVIPPYTSYTGITGYKGWRDNRGITGRAISSPDREAKISYPVLSLGSVIPRYTDVGGPR